MSPVERELAGWGNHPVERCYVTRPDTVSLLQKIVTDGECRDYIPRGLGRAYGDSAINAGRGVILQTRMDRFLAFDPKTGVLECESGVSIEDIIHHLLPRGWFVPVTPGTKYVTLGGAIAADIHGKNHHAEGSIGVHLDEIKLMIADGSVRTLTPKDPLFWATVGGMGLTGIIVSAKLRMRPVESAFFKVRYVRSRNLEETLRNIHETNARYRYSVAWVDCLASGNALGRSVLMLSEESRRADLPKKLAKDPLRLSNKLRTTVPVKLPSFLLNQYSVAAFNAVFYGVSPDRERFADYDAFYYPLDLIRKWNNIYGHRGFVQYQALFPPETTEKGLVALLQRIAKSRRASFLAVLKSSGPANDAPLSFLYEGHTLALDLPFTKDLPELVDELDRILLDYGGRIYLAKDALTTADFFKRMYPRLPEFQAIKAEVDPHNRFVSSQARRVGIV